MILALAMGCSGGSPSTGYSSTAFQTGTQGSDTQTGTPTGTDTETPTDGGGGTDTSITTTTGGTVTLPTGLNGTLPAQNLPVPSFTQVLAMDGTARSSADLQGAPTVMWFYPAAMTGG